MKLALIAVVLATSTGCMVRRSAAPEPSKLDEIDRRLSRIEKMLENRPAEAPARIEKELGRAQVLRKGIELKKVVKTPSVTPRPFLGIKPVDSDEGVRIEQVLDGTAAERAELQAGDIILTVNGTKTGTVEDLVKAIRSNKIGSTVTIGFIRGKKHYEVTATLGKFAD